VEIRDGSQKFEDEYRINKGNVQLGRQGGRERLVAT